jgi:hypothetical protein
MSGLASPCAALSIAIAHNFTMTVDVSQMGHALNAIVKKWHCPLPFGQTRANLNTPLRGNR